MRRIWRFWFWGCRLFEVFSTGVLFFFFRSLLGVLAIELVGDEGKKEVPVQNLRSRTRTKLSDNCDCRTKKIATKGEQVPMHTHIACCPIHHSYSTSKSPSVKVGGG